MLSLSVVLRWKFKPRGVLVTMVNTLQYHVAFDQARDIRVCHARAGRATRAGCRHADRRWVCGLGLCATGGDPIGKRVEHYVSWSFPRNRAGRRRPRQSPRPAWRRLCSGLCAWLSRDRSGIESASQIEAAADRADRGCLAIQAGEQAQTVDGFDAGAVRTQQIFQAEFLQPGCGPGERVVAGLIEVEAAQRGIDGCERDFSARVVQRVDDTGVTTPGNHYQSLV